MPYRLVYFPIESCALLVLLFISFKCENHACYRGSMLQITEERSKLPIGSFRDTVTSALESHQVVFITCYIKLVWHRLFQVKRIILENMWLKSRESCGPIEHVVENYLREK